MDSEFSNIGKLNVFWFIASQLTVVLSITETFGQLTINFLPSFKTDFIYNLFIIFVATNIILKLLYSQFIYATTVRSCLLGNVFGIGIYIIINLKNPWNIVGWYLCVLSGFHFSEFLSIAYCNTSSLSVSSFILNHSREYWIALAVSWVEFVLETTFCPVIKSFSIISWIGLILCVVGECIRKLAMITASTNFNHIVQYKKSDDHKLVTNGIYSLCRHPSYVGWFLWSIATQLLLMNPICSIAYTYVSWLFFRARIMEEEWYLLNFFQDEYSKYQQKVGTGIPFIKGLVVNFNEPPQ